MNRYIILFDGICNFCNFWINFILKRDKKKVFLFAPLQSGAGQSYLKKFKLNQTHFDTFILIEGDKYYTMSDAAIIIAKNLSGPAKLLYLLKVLPKSLRDWGYSVIAKNRYKLFGERDTCRLPEPGEKERFIENWE
jgi:predicted DCC family thiol-disulfide oxidoreductase YuxK